MWRIIFITALTYIFGVTCRPMETLEGPLWLNRIPDNMASEEGVLNEEPQPDLYEQRNPSKILQNNKDGNYYIILLRPPNDKRAISMFSRWGALGNYPKERSSIRNNMPTEQGGITTRGRQPLRWG